MRIAWKIVAAGLNLEAALKYYETAYEKALKANPQTAGFYKTQADRLKNRLSKKQ